MRGEGVCVCVCVRVCVCVCVVLHSQAGCPCALKAVFTSRSSTGTTTDLIYSNYTVVRKHAPIDQY